MAARIHWGASQMKSGVIQCGQQVMNVRPGFDQTLGLTKVANGVPIREAIADRVFWFHASRLHSLCLHTVGKLCTKDS